MRHHDRDHIDSGALFWGLILIAAGSIFLLDRLDFGDTHQLIRDYWPVFIIVMGLARLPQRGHVWNGLWLIGVGAWLQACVLHLGGLTFRNSWPLIVIFCGASMVLQTIVQGVRSRSRSSNETQQSEVGHD